MAKKRPSFFCIACGVEFPKWFGRCPDCNEWNSLVPAESLQKKVARAGAMTPLSVIPPGDLARIKTDMAEFNLVCGGGIVPGSVILVGGEPGIGKSTLAMQIARSFRTLYVSGEESPMQLRHRAERLGVDTERIFVSTNTAVEELRELIAAEKPECVIVDSVQTLYLAGIPSLAGSVSQVRESTSRLAETARSTGIPVILIGHITKEGSIAGPKVLEHLVDTVLYFEGDFSRDFRILRAFKNRFGSVNEVGLFRMSEKGLAEVKDKNSLFLNPFSSPSPGNGVSAALEGSRTILFEVQSLVTFTSFSNPRRMADGFDLNRLILLVAVLEKHALLKLGTFDVFINVAGGFRITDTSADLAVAMSITSSLKGRAVPSDTGLLGEISLAGEIRPVSQPHRRLQELRRSGFKTVLISANDGKRAKEEGFEGEIVGINNIAEAMDFLF